MEQKYKNKFSFSEEGKDLVYNEIRVKKQLEKYILSLYDVLFLLLYVYIYIYEYKQNLKAVFFLLKQNRV